MSDNVRIVCVPCIDSISVIELKGNAVLSTNQNGALIHKDGSLVCCIFKTHSSTDLTMVSLPYFVGAVGYGCAVVQVSNASSVTVNQSEFKAVSDDLVKRVIALTGDAEREDSLEASLASPSVDARTACHPCAALEEVAPAAVIDVGPSVAVEAVVQVAEVAASPAACAVACEPVADAPKDVVAEEKCAGCVPQGELIQEACAAEASSSTVTLESVKAASVAARVPVAGTQRTVTAGIRRQQRTALLTGGFSMSKSGRVTAETEMGKFAVRLSPRSANVIEMMAARGHEPFYDTRAFNSQEPFSDVTFKLPDAASEMVQIQWRKALNSWLATTLHS